MCNYFSAFFSGLLGNPSSREYQAAFLFDDFDEASEFYKEVMKFTEGKESEFKVVDLTLTPFSVYKGKEYKRDKFYLEIIDDKPYISVYNGYITYDARLYEADGYRHTTFSFGIAYEFDSLQELAHNMDKCLEESKYFVKEIKQYGRL